MSSSIMRANHVYCGCSFGLCRNCMNANATCVECGHEHGEPPTLCSEDITVVQFDQDGESRGMWRTSVATFVSELAYEIERHEEQFREEEPLPF